MPPFRLDRFTGDLEFGHAIVRDDDTVEYLKTSRLSDAQVRRAYLPAGPAGAGDQPEDQHRAPQGAVEEDAVDATTSHSSGV